MSASDQCVYRFNENVPSENVRNLLTIVFHIF